MKSRIFKVLFWIFIIATTLSSCEDNTFKSGKESFISIHFDDPETRAVDKEGEEEDNIVHTMRILAFDRVTGNIVNNNLHHITQKVIRIQFKPGIYDLVFLANEPSYTNVKTALNGITTLNALKAVTYPEQAFISNLNIPMVQVIENIEIKEGNAIFYQNTYKINGTQGAHTAGDVTNEIQLDLGRLAIRVDLTLTAPEDLEQAFTAVTFTNIPEVVPVLPPFSSYSGYDSDAISRSAERTFTKDQFTTIAPEDGYVWAKQLQRIVLPANHFTDKTSDDNATFFTVNLENKYSPTAALKIEDNNYTLPYNTWLDVTGRVKMPIEVNIEVGNWSYPWNSWAAGNRSLNVSQTEVSITDYNGAIISFWSDAKTVTVLPKVKVVKSNNANYPKDAYFDTNQIFNDLISTKNQSPTRLSYDAGTGSGFMEILVDQLNEPGEYTFELTLSAQDLIGGQLNRVITVNVQQLGYRSKFNTWGGGYVGAFFRNEQTGERIIMGQHTPGEAWQAVVTSGTDWLIISPVPSLDPTVGTDNPGVAEYYRVALTDRNNNDGKTASGKGRIYFRVGVKEGEAQYSGPPRYGTINLSFRYDEENGTIWNAKADLYVRQGEDPDFLYSTDQTVPAYNPAVDAQESAIKGQTRSYANKFSVYNLTHRTFKSALGGTGSEANYYEIGFRDGVEVEFPTQTGAFFQYAVDREGSDAIDIKYRRAYHPVRNAIATGDDPEFLMSGSTTVSPGTESPPYWDAPSGSTYGYGSEFEICPPGYHRPTDGKTDAIVYNGPYNVYKQIARDIVGNDFPPVGYLPRPDEQYFTASGGVTANNDYSADIISSEARTSLFRIPQGGDSFHRNSRETVIARMGTNEYTTIYEVVPRTYPPVINSAMKAGVLFGFYADGFFDRHPIKTNGGVGVSLSNAHAAYKGVLLYDTDSGIKRSLFFPASGRLSNTDQAGGGPKGGELQYNGQTAFYWTSSVGPWYVSSQYGVWTISLAPWDLGMTTALPTFGLTLRCVTD